MNQRRIDRSVEDFCQQGCRAVWAGIQALEAGRSLPEVAGLSPREVRAVIAELRSVMAVYDRVRATA